MIWARHKPGDRDRGCELTRPDNCRKSCCPIAPPETLTIEVWNTGQPCECEFGSLAYVKQTNPDGHLGMWLGTITVKCGSGCDPETVQVKVWCNLYCEDGTQCLCDCEQWSIAIDDGSTVRVEDSPGTLVENCCCDGFLRSWAVWEDVVAGTGNCTGSTFCARISWGTGCQELVNTAGCTAPIGRFLNIFVNGPCGDHSFQIEAVDNEYNCEADVVWTGSGTVQCQSTEGGGCVNVTMTVTLRLTKSGCPADKIGTPSEWEWEVDLDCQTGVTHQVITVQCPTCSTSQFSTSPAQEVITSLLCSMGTCNSTQNNFSIWAEDACFQNNSCGLDTTVQLISVDVAHPEWGCGRGLPSFRYDEPNHCDCSGRWRGFMTQRFWDDDSQSLQPHVMEVEICDGCNDCDREACGWGNYSIKINGGPAKTAEKGCCNTAGQVGRFRGHIYFGQVVIGGDTAGPGAGRTIHVNIGWQENMMLATTGFDPLLPVSSHWTVSYTDPSGVTRLATLEGRLTCEEDTDPTDFSLFFIEGYYNIFETRTPETFDCGNGVVHFAHFKLRQRHFDKPTEWHLIIEIDGQDTIVLEPTPTWQPCTPSAPHSMAAEIPDTTVQTICGASTGPIPITILEVQSLD